MKLSNYIVVSTTNIGARVLMASKTADRETIVRRTLQAVRSEMRPETFARFDLACVFDKLDWEKLSDIARLHTAKSLQIINSLGHNINADEAVTQHICREGFSEEFGARPMQTAAMRILGRSVANEVLRNGGEPVTGTIVYDQRTNTCSLALPQKN